MRGNRQRHLVDPTCQEVRQRRAAKGRRLPGARGHFACSIWYCACVCLIAMLLLAGMAALHAAPNAPAAATKGNRVPLTPGRGPRVSLDVHEIDVRTVLTVLGENAQVRFSLAPDVRGKVTCSYRDLALEEMLDVILPPLGLRWKRLAAQQYRVERAVEQKTGKALLSSPRGWDPAGLKALYYNDPACELADGSLSALLAVPPEGVTVVTRTDARPGGIWSETGPAPGVGPAQWSARWTGRLYVPADDSYTFSFDPIHGAALLLLDGKVVVDSWRIAPRGKTAGSPVKLSHGWHDVVIEYHQAGPTGALDLKWQASWLPLETIGIHASGKPAQGRTTP
ncbi:MAG TPA: PA14 domain-containing protein [Armatimonadota bacterium]|nr:PA14 domain-containing protein [Armatimonadota bacterium]